MTFVSYNDETISKRLFADDCLAYREINHHNDYTQLSECLASIENEIKEGKNGCFMRYQQNQKCP